MSSNSLVLLWMYNSQRRRLNEERNFYHRYDAFDLSDALFIKNYRLNKPAAEALIGRLQPHLTESVRLTAKNKVLAALSFFGSGSYQLKVGNDLFLAISQASVSRAINEVISVINTHLLHEMVKFPNSSDDLLAIKKEFMKEYKYPGIIGVVDCTHVAIVPPYDNPPHVVASSYVNRKGFHSINVQLVCDLNLYIYNVNARFPGSVHDAFIFKHSLLRQHLENEHRHNPSYGWLIGDSGYALEPWIMTPFADPSTTVEENYNVKHQQVRNCIEHCNGVLKNRFRCLLKHRVLHYKPATAGKIINSCVVLHNWCLKYGVSLPDEESTEDKKIKNKNKATPVCRDSTTQPLALLEKAKRIRQEIANGLVNPPIGNM